MRYDDALAKVVKLLNMTTDNGCTESEAKVAAGMAQKLMLRYKIAEDDLGMVEPEEELRAWEDPLDVIPGKLAQHWRGALAVMLCRANGCAVFWWRYEEKPILKMAGRASDVTTVRYMYEFILREMERLASQYRGNGKTWMNNWRWGFVSGIGESLREARSVVRSEYTGETALVRVDTALAKIDQHAAEADVWARRTFKLRNGGGHLSNYDSDGHSTGRRDGKSVNLNSNNGQLGGGQRRLK